MKRWRLKSFLLLIPLLLFGLAHMDRLESGGGGDWRIASRAPVGLAPSPDSVREAVIQVYGARAVRWRGYFGIHTWVAVKPSDASAYTVYEVIGWRLRRDGNSVVIAEREPDARWFGAAPQLLAEQRGDGVDDMIERIAAAADDYPWAGTYRVWPGPNSNTFVAWLLRTVPELRSDLPATAIGKDYLGWRSFAAAPSGTGYQFNLFGVLGVLVALEEGLEINVLGLTFGVDPLGLSLKLPLVGRLGAAAS